MKRMVQIEIGRCFECHYREELGGLAGESSWCTHPKVGGENQICGDEGRTDYPSWCPLPMQESGSLDNALSDVLSDLGRMSRRWRRGCGRPGGADCQQEWANIRADDRVKVCIKEVEEFIAAKASGQTPKARKDG